MADWGRSSGGSRGRVGTWDDAERRRRALAWTDSLPGLGRAAEHLRNWAIADTGPGRLLPWLPVAFGLGIALYFTADLNPQSLEVLGDARVEPELAAASNSAEPVQFERQGYFVRDPDSTPDRPVFNRTVGLRDTFAKEVGGRPA